ncbi:threonine synthase [Planctomicrobium piriforme]|uniref:Threonine synthase n=1 Tax=Planctomicrobium piriforme TaxID=1576369 RepID=A0A1I3P9I2_9PLAN|nr:threonine synthase [Planctomicrobium piriforme]SFJ18089.1 threonine synthase [Planctomicrobium piriforme]
MSSDVAFQSSIGAGPSFTYGIDEVLTACPRSGKLLDVQYDWNRVPVPSSLKEFEARWSRRGNPLDFSGVWRFRELLPFAPDNQIVTIGEGQTILQNSPQVARYAGMNTGCLFLQYEGLNPSGSFKDNGMTAASTHARMVGAKVAACASTGNTSASLAIYAGVTGLFKVIVFVGSGKIAYGKLSQALDYGALTLQIEGDFDDALKQVQAVSKEAGIYLCNSVNPFRLEGQKSIMYRVLEGLGWEIPDWIVVPGGNLGNSSAFGKAFIELKQLGLIDRIPRLAVINAAGANTLYELYEKGGLRWNNGSPDEALVDSFYRSMDSENRRAKTLASAIEINRPVNLEKCLRALDACDGVVREVSDEDILDAKAQVGAGGFGCEPASGASVAGAKLLRQQGIIAPSDRVVCILTGHQLKDPSATVHYHAGNGQTGGSGADSAEKFQNRPVAVPNNMETILDVIRKMR